MTWTLYLLLVNIYLIIFYGFYRLLLAKETFFSLNRMYILSAGVFSLLIPMIKIDWLAQQTITTQVYVQALQASEIMGVVNEQEKVASTINWTTIISIIYLAGTIFCTILFIAKLLKVKRMFSNQNENAAFSFWKKKVVNLDLPEAATINSHEDTHIKQLHTLDVIFFEILAIITWFNPIIYLYKKEIKDVHEYLADQAVVEQTGNKEAYAYLLLNQSFSIPSTTVVNSFFNKSMVKKRIFMIYKEKSNKSAILKYGIAVPLFGLALLFSAATIKDNKKLKATAEEIKLEKATDVISNALTAEKNEIPAINNASSSKPSSDLKQAKQKSISLHKVGSQNEVEQDTAVSFVKTEVPPKFPGGIAEFYKFLGKNIRYPEKAIAANINGNVYVSFVVEKTGELSNIQVTRSLGHGTDEEAVRVLKLSPKWEPGILKGKPVSVKYNLPIQFRTNKQKVMLKTHNNLDSAGVPPLYVVDGKIVDNISYIKPNDIEEVNVLKGPGATTKFGEKGKNGAIIITTKVKKNN